MTSPERRGFHFPAVFLTTIQDYLGFGFFSQGKQNVKICFATPRYFLLPFLLVFSAFGQVFNSHHGLFLKIQLSRDRAAGRGGRRLHTCDILLRCQTISISKHTKVQPASQRTSPWKNKNRQLIAKKHNKTPTTLHSPCQHLTKDSRFQKPIPKFPGKQRGRSNWGQKEEWEPWRRKCRVGEHLQPGWMAP